MRRKIALPLGVIASSRRIIRKASVLKAAFDRRKTLVKKSA